MEPKPIFSLTLVAQGIQFVAVNAGEVPVLEIPYHEVHAHQNRLAIVNFLRAGCPAVQVITQTDTTFIHSPKNHKAQMAKFLRHLGEFFALCQRTGESFKVKHLMDREIEESKTEAVVEITRERS